MRDQLIACTAQERAYLIDALMVFVQKVDQHWEPLQSRELQVLLEHLMTPDPREYASLADIKHLLGKQVQVRLTDGSGEGRQFIRGRLLGFGDGGEFEVEADDGSVHYCWPMLEIELREGGRDLYGEGNTRCRLGTRLERCGG